MQAIELWMSAHPALATVVIWPLVTMIINAVFDLVKMHTKDSAFARCLDAFFSAAGLDAVKAVAALKGLLGGGGAPPRAGSDRAMRPYDPESTPTSPSRMVRRSSMLLAGVVLAAMIAACQLARDASKWGIDEAECVYQHTDQGQKVDASVLLACGIENTPDALKFFADLVAQRAAARRAAACMPADAGAK